MSPRLMVETQCEFCSQMGPHAVFSNPWYSHNHGGTREEASIETVVAWLREQGAGEEVQWCEYHRSQRGQGLKNECWRAQKARDVGYDDYEDCKMVSRLMIVGTTLPPTGETP